MSIYSLEPTVETLHGQLSREIPPILTINPGDTVIYKTLDADWGNLEQADPFQPPTKFEPVDPTQRSGHALVGPVAVRGAQPGMVLEVHFKAIRPGKWGWTYAGGTPSPWNERLGIAEGTPMAMRWAINADAGTAQNQFGRTVRLRPFMGLFGMPPNEPGSHPTRPPRYCGGNMDCKELVEGSSVFLPISVESALFFIGDGHAVQGDGEVAGPALECPMEHVEVEFRLHRDMHLTNPRALTPTAWVTLGFHEDLNEAMWIALEEMLTLIEEKHKMTRKEAMAMTSLLADLRVTQIVNGVRGVHAVLPHAAWLG